MSKLKLDSSGQLLHVCSSPTENKAGEGNTVYSNVLRESGLLGFLRSAAIPANSRVIQREGPFA